MRYVVTSRRGRALAFASLCVFVLAISGCGHQPQPSAYDPPGFWSGLLHGFLILFSFIGSLFTDVRIYARVAHTCRCEAVKKLKKGLTSYIAMIGCFRRPTTGRRRGWATSP